MNLLYLLVSILPWSALAAPLSKRGYDVHTGKTYYIGSFNPEVDSINEMAIGTDGNFVGADLYVGPINHFLQVWLDGSKLAVAYVNGANGGHGPTNYLTVRDDKSVRITQYGTEGFSIDGKEIKFQGESAFSVCLDDWKLHVSGYGSCSNSSDTRIFTTIKGN